MIKNIETLLDGELALENAPKTVLADGRFCIPQHYLSYQHTLQSVEQLLLDIDFDPRYPIFVSQDMLDANLGMYIQVGIIGTDNYQTSAPRNQQDKIVYGRKWRVESQLPTSEIIQTVFLALKKAREHEVRELFRLKHQGKITTPFNNHHDLPLLTNSRERLQVGTEEQPTNTQDLFITEVKNVLKTIRYSHAQFELMNLILRPTGEYLVELNIMQDPHNLLPEFSNHPFISLFVHKMDINHVLQQLMQQLIQISDRYVDEKFYYRGFNRFSWDNDIKAIAQLSSEVRQLHKSEDSKNFTQHWQKNNYETDRSRIPMITSGALWNKLKTQFEAFSPIKSTLPINAINTIHSEY